MTESVAPSAVALTADEPSRPIESDARSAIGQEQPDAGLLESDLLLEDVSIDGMCGVY